MLAEKARGTYSIAMNIHEVLSEYGIADATSIALPAGTNLSFRIDCADGTFLLQRVSEAESASALDIAAVTAHIIEKEIETPQVIPTQSGELETVRGDGIWRLCTWIPGRTTHSEYLSTDEARSMAALLGRFHSALADFSAPLSPRYAFHDCPAVEAHLAALQRQNVGSELHERIAPLFERARAVCVAESVSDFPLRVCHGDPKVANVVFDADAYAARAYIDLGTVGRYPVAIDVGDMLRSMCSLATGFRYDRFSETLDAYRAEATFLTDAESHAIPRGMRAVMAELAMRYLADAYEQRIFVGKDASACVARAQLLVTHAEETRSL